MRANHSPENLTSLSQWALDHLQRSDNSELQTPFPSNYFVLHIKELLGHSNHSPLIQSAINSLIPALLLIVLTALIFGPGITGFTTYYLESRLELNATIHSSQNITVELNDNPTTVRITGSLEGSGIIQLAKTRAKVVRSNIQHPDILVFSSSCRETCNQGSYGTPTPQGTYNLTLEILLQAGAHLNLSSISYSYKTINHAPQFNSRLSNLTAKKGTNISLDLFAYAIDPDNDTLTFVSTTTPLADVQIQGKLLIVSPYPESIGQTSLVLYASDLDTISSINITIHIFEDATEEEIQASNAPFTIDPGTLQSITLFDETQVIIELKHPSWPVSDAISSNEIKKVQDGISNLVSDSSGQLTDDIHVTREFNHIPALAATITKEGLDHLLSNNEITAVYIDEEFSVSLQDSNPHYSNPTNLDHLGTIFATPTHRTLQDGKRLYGKGQTACLIDTGVQANHPDLTGNILPGINTLYGTNDSEDDNGHGTAVAGILSSSFGIAPASKIYPVKACDFTGSCKASNLLSGLDACLEGVGRLNITTIIGSFGDAKSHTVQDCPKTFDSAFSRAMDRGVSLVFAAGNNGYFDGVNYPACDERAISVGSNTNDGALTNFTNKGSKVDIYAPGKDIETTMISNTRSSSSGTSISTPFVAGSILLLNEAAAKNKSTLNPNTIKEIILNSSTNVSGNRILNVAQALSTFIPSVMNQTSLSELNLEQKKNLSLHIAPEKQLPFFIQPSLLQPQGLNQESKPQKINPFLLQEINAKGKGRVIIELQLPESPPSPQSVQQPGFSVSSKEVSGLGMSTAGSSRSGLSGIGISPSDALSLKEYTKEKIAMQVKTAQQQALSGLATNQAIFGTLSAEETTEDLTEHNFSVEPQPTYVPYLVGTITSKGLASLETNPAVKAVYADRIRDLMPTILPAEEKLSFDVSIPTVGVPFVREHTNLSGKGILIAVIDSGIDYTHPDLGNCTTTMFRQGTCTKVPLGYNFCAGASCSQDPDPIDTFGHGTHVAGIIGATGAFGMMGIAPSSHFIAIKSCNATGSCPDSSIIAGMDYAIAHNASIISLSLGANMLPNDGNDVVSQVAQQAVSIYGIPVISAAGNSGPGTGSVANPAASQGVISVAASHDHGTTTITDDTIALFSNRGPLAFGRFGPDISAPGVSINSTVPYSTTCTASAPLCSTTGYKISSGTSFSTPHITGIVALLLEQDPNRTPLKIRSLVLGTAANMTGHPFEKGAGLANASAALTSNIFASINGQEKAQLEALPGSYIDFNVSLENTDVTARTFSFLVEEINEPNGNLSLPSPSIKTPLPLLVEPQQSRQSQQPKIITLRLNTPPQATPGVYGGTIIAVTDKGESIRLPFALTVPFLSSGFATGRTGDSVTGTQTGDIHYFKINHGNASSFTATLQWPQPSHDLDLYLFSPGGLLLGMSAGLEEPETIQVSKRYDTSSWIAVHGYTVPSTGTAFNLTINSRTNLTTEPSFIVASILTNQTKNLTISVLNHQPPTTINARLTRSLGGSKVTLQRMIAGNATTTISIPVTSISSPTTLNLSEISSCNASLTWGDPGINLDMGVFTSSNGGSTNISRDPMSANDNSQLGIAAEYLPRIDVRFITRYFSDWGIAVINNNGTNISANVSIACTRDASAEEAAIHPESLTLGFGQAGNLTITINGTTMPAGSIIDYALVLQTNATNELARVPITILSVHVPNPTLAPYFDGQTTNLQTILDATSIQSMTLERTGIGRIQWVESIDAQKTDFIDAVQLEPGFVTINASSMDVSLNSSITVQFEKTNCSGYAVFSSPAVHRTKAGIISSGTICSPTTYPACTAIDCTANTLTLTAANPASFAVLSGLENTTINDSNIRNSVATNTTITQSAVNDSTLLFSTIHNASVTNTFLQQSTVESATIAEASAINSIINLSTIYNSTATNSTLLEVLSLYGVFVSSYVDPSNITNSTITNSFVEDSRIDNSTITLSNVTNATVNASLLNRANVSNATIRHATIHNTTFFDTTIENVTISNGINISCGQTLTGNLNLSFNVQGTTPCYNAGADGITINCNGYSITGIDNNAIINITRRNGVRVANCNMFGPGQAVFITGSNNTHIINTSAGLSGINITGISINSTFNRVVNISTLILEANASFGSYANISANSVQFSGTGNNLTNSSINVSAIISGENTTLTLTTFSGSGDALTISGSGHTIANNSLNGSIALGGLTSSRISDNNLTSSCIGVFGIVVRSGIVISGNRIYSCSGSKTAIAMNPDFNSNITISNNQMLSSSFPLTIRGGNDYTILSNIINASGPIRFSSMNNTLFANNTIEGPSNYPALDLANLTNANIMENTLANATGSNSIGIRLSSSIENGTLTGIQLNNNTIELFTDCISTRSGEQYPPQFNGTRIFGNILRNCTIGIRLEANASGSTGTGINISHTQIFSSENGIIISDLTDTLIQTIRINATQSTGVIVVNSRNTTFLNSSITGSTIGLIFNRASRFFAKDLIISNATSGALILNGSTAGTLVNISLNSTSTSILIVSGLNHTINQTNAHLPVILENASFTKINFTSQVNFSSNSPISSIVNLSNNSITINSTQSSSFNISAILTFNISFTEPTPGYDPEQDGSYDACPISRCVSFGQNGSLFVFNVTGFSSYNSINPFPGSTITNSTVNGTAAENTTITNSTVTNSTLNSSTITNSSIDNSSISNSSILNSRIDNSTIKNTTSNNLFSNSSAIDGRTVSNSTILQSIINVSVISNTSIAFSNLSTVRSNTSIIENSSQSQSNVSRSFINLSTTDTAHIINASISFSDINQTTIDNSTIHQSNTTRSTINGSNLDLTHAINSTLRFSTANESVIDNTTTQFSNITSQGINQSDIANSSIWNSNSTDSVVVRTVLTNSTVKNASVFRILAATSKLDNSTLSTSNITRSVINISMFDRSTILNASAFQCDVNASIIFNATIIFSNITRSFINDSTVSNSTTTNSSIRVSSINASTLLNSSAFNSTLIDSALNFSHADNTTLVHSNLTISPVNRSRIDSSDIFNSSVQGSSINQSSLSLSAVRNTTIANASLNLSTIFNSTIINASVLSTTLNQTITSNSTTLNVSSFGGIINNSNLENSTVLFGNLTIAIVYNSHIENSTVLRSNITNGNVTLSRIENSSVDNSSVTTSILINVTVINSTLQGETIANDVIQNGLSVAACAKILSRHAVVTSDISCAFAGLIQNTTNTTIDCNGFSITGNATSIGIEIGTRQNVTIQSCTLSNFSTALAVNRSNFTTLRNVFAIYSRIGIHIINASNLTISNLSAVQNQAAGLLLDPLNNVTIENSTFAGGTNGLLILDVNNSRIAYNTFENATNGINITNGFSIIIRNNTFKNNNVSLRITSGIDNRVFFNNFSQAGELHISSPGGNLYNTTVSARAAGNEYDNARILRMYDQNNDGFAEQGPDYPYNSTNNGTVTINVTDFGPITNRTDVSPTQSGTINNVTLTSGTNKSTINLSAVFSDPDNDPLNFTITGNQSIGVSINATSTIVTILAPQNFTGSETVTFIANDSILRTTSVITITVEEPAQPPPATGGTVGGAGGGEGAGPSGGPQGGPAAPPPIVAPPPAAVSASKPTGPPPEIKATAIVESPEIFRGELLTKIKETPIACGYRTKKTIEHEIIPNLTTIGNIPIPAGFSLATSPFSLSCNGDSLDLTLNLPSPMSDIRALRCRKEGCDTIIQKEIITQELVCGGKTISQIRREELSKRKQTLSPKEVGIIIQEGSIITPEKRVVISGKNRVEFPRQISKPFRIDISSPKTEVPVPKNPSASIIGTPLEVIISDAQGPLAATITVPFTIPENFDPETFALFAQNDQNWIFLPNSVTDHQEQTLTVEVPDILKYTSNGVGHFAVIGVGCAACLHAKLQRVYNPESSRTAIILIHGFASGPKTWQFLIDDLTLSQQPYQVYTLDYSSSQPVTKTAQEFMDQMEAQTGNFDTVYLAAHSLGGFVAQHALSMSKATTYTWPSKVRKLIMIGTPNGGTPGANVYQRLYSSLINEQNLLTLYNPNSSVLQDLSKGINIARKPGIDYYVIAGSKPYDFSINAFKVEKNGKEIIIPNDGITTTLSAQLVSGQPINNSCKDYFELNATHTELLDNPVARRIISRIISEDQFKKTGKGLGYNQYLRLQVEDCSPEEQFLVIGKPVKPEAAPAPLNCNCGNDVCGIDETPETCPRDCAIKLERPAGDIAKEISAYLITVFFLGIILWTVWRKMKKADTRRAKIEERKTKVIDQGGHEVKPEGIRSLPPINKPERLFLAPFERLKLELQDLKENMQRIIGAATSPHQFYPPAPLQKKISDTSKEDMPRETTLSERIKNNLSEIKNRYPLIRKESPAQTKPLRGTGEATHYPLRTLSEECSRILDGIRRKKSTAAIIENKITPPYSRIRPDEKQKILALIKRAHVTRPAASIETEKRQSRPRVSTIIQGELSNLFSDARRFIEGTSDSERTLPKNGEKSQSPRQESKAIEKHHEQQQGQYLDTPPSPPYEGKNPPHADIPQPHQRHETVTGMGLPTFKRGTHVFKKEFSEVTSLMNRIIGNQAGSAPKKQRRTKP